MHLVGLESQSQCLHGSINKRIQAVLDHCQCILGAEIAELERHSPSTWVRTIASPSPVEPMLPYLTDEQQRTIIQALKDSVLELL